MLLSYKSFIGASADEIAAQLHMSKDMVAEQSTELNYRGLLKQNMVPVIESRSKTCFSLPNELFFLNIGHGAITTPTCFTAKIAAPISVIPVTAPSPLQYTLPCPLW